MGLLKKVFGSATPTGPPQRPPSPVEVTVSLFEGDEQLSVVGESNYQEALWKVVKDIGYEVPAILQPEPNNPYDSNAIAVLAAGMVVGYLSREDAVRYLPGLLKLQASRGRPIALNAKIFGGVEAPQASAFGSTTTPGTSAFRVESGPDRRPRPD